MNWRGGGTGPPNAMSGRSVNPIPTRECRLSPPITTGTPNVFHLPASLHVVYRYEYQLTIKFCLDFHHVLKLPRLPYLFQRLVENEQKDSEYYLLCWITIKEYTYYKVFSIWSHLQKMNKIIVHQAYNIVCKKGGLISLLRLPWVWLYEMKMIKFTHWENCSKNERNREKPDIETIKKSFFLKLLLSSLLV